MRLSAARIAARQRAASRCRADLVLCAARAPPPLPILLPLPPRPATRDDPAAKHRPAPTRPRSAAAAPPCAGGSRTSCAGGSRTSWGFFECARAEDTALGAPVLRIEAPRSWTAAPLSEANANIVDGQAQPPLLLTRPVDPDEKRLAFGPFAFKLSPSSEVLAWLCCRSAAMRAKLRQKRLLEVGSGLGLTGLACAAWCDCTSLTLTDGDPASVSAIRASVELNRAAGTFGGTAVEAAQLRWDEHGTGSLGERTFDVILCADCVYDRDWHAPLVATLKRYLHPEGCVLLVASGATHTHTHTHTGPRDQRLVHH